jgi:hypothetical protein
MSFANCYATSNICRGCRDNVGGVKRAYVFAGCVTGTTENENEEIETIGGTGGTVYSFEVEKNTSNFVETITASIENGTVLYQQTLNLVFLKLQQSTRNQIKLLAQNTNLKMVVETNEGTLWYLGENFGLALSSGTAETGTLYTDRNGYSLVFEGFEKEPAKALVNPIEDALDGFTLSEACVC